MDDEHARLRVCGSKKHYRLEYNARKAAARIMAKQLNMRHMSHYLCPFCGHYHVGHTPYELRPVEYRQYG